MTSTPILKSRTPRFREPICPPWCEGHDDHYNPWERHGPEDVLGRDHARTISLEEVPYSVTINAFEVHGTNELQPATVDIYGDGADNLTPGQARAAMAILRTQLEQIEEWQS